MTTACRNPPVANTTKSQTVQSRLFAAKPTTYKGTLRQGRHKPGERTKQTGGFQQCFDCWNPPVQRSARIHAFCDVDRNPAALRGSRGIRAGNRNDNGIGERVGSNERLELLDLGGIGGTSAVVALVHVAERPSEAIVTSAEKETSFLIYPSVMLRVSCAPTISLRTLSPVDVDADASYCGLPATLLPHVWMVSARVTLSAIELGVMAVARVFSPVTEPDRAAAITHTAAIAMRRTRRIIDLCTKNSSVFLPILLMGGCGRPHFPRATGLRGRSRDLECTQAERKAG